MRKHRLTIVAALSVAIPLASCSASDDWDSQEQRDAAFQEYACKKLEDTPPNEVSSNLIGVAQSVSNDPGDRAVLIRHAQMIGRGVMEPTCDKSSPYYESDVVKAWGKYAETEYGKDFTPSTARDAGIPVG